MLVLHHYQVRHYYQSIAKSARKDFRDGAVVPFEWLWVLLGNYLDSLFCIQGILLYFTFRLLEARGGIAINCIYDDARLHAPRP